MRLGCSGCLGFVIGLAVLGLVVGGTIGALARMLVSPPGEPQLTAAADGSRAQQKIFELPRHARRGDTVVLTEAELNALLARHLVSRRGLALSAPRATLVGEDRVVIDARSPARQLLEEASLGAVADILPSRWQARPLWIRVGLHLRIDADGTRRQLRLDADEFAVGRQRLPVSLVRLLLDPATVGLTQWPLPDYIDRIDIEPGRVVFRPLRAR